MKTPAFGLLSKGKVHARVIPDAKKRTLQAIIDELVQAKHLPKYCKEFVFRYNTRDKSDGEHFEEFLKSKHDRYLYGEIIMRPAYVDYNMRLTWERDTRFKLKIRLLKIFYGINRHSLLIHRMGRHFMLYNIFSGSSAICSCMFQKFLLTLRIKNPQKF